MLPCDPLKSFLSLTKLAKRVLVMAAGRRCSESELLEHRAPKWPRRPQSLTPIMKHPTAVLYSRTSSTFVHAARATSHPDFLCDVYPHCHCEDACVDAQNHVR